MKKAFGQTVRDLKREVNKKVLQVPKIEQKVLDATSNEPWGPHGTLLADIAQATRNYHEYQMIMSVLWKRISDTGKNWRHVYKGLTVLEYLVANGSERVIDDIKEHAYQISTLSNFQYIDSSGRDQGNNVRRKSQSLVSLVNDKERIVEVREKAAINREKFRPAGGMHRPGSYSGSGGYGDRYDDDRYGRRDEDRYNYGYDDKYGRGGDSYSRDGERYEERYGRDGYKDDSYMGRSRSVDDFQNGPRSRSPEIGRALDDDGQYSSRGSGARTEDTSVDGRPIDRKFSEQNLDSKYSEQNSGAPPSYEEAVGESRSPVYSERDGDAPVASAPQSSSPPVQSNTVQEASAVTSQEFEAFDEFDPRSSFPAPNTSTNVGATISEHAAPAIPSNPEMDLIGSFTDPFTADVMALVPATTGTASAAATHGNSAAAATFTTAQSASNAMNQSFEDPFGDGPFKAIPSSENFAGQPNASVSAAPFQPSTNQNAELFHNGSLKADTATNYDFGDSFASVTYAASNVSSVQPSTVSQFSPQGFSAPQQETDILAGILPPSEPSPAPASQTAFSASACEAGLQGANISASTQPDMGPTVPVASHTPQAQTGPDQQLDTAGFLSFGEPNTGGSSQTNALVPFGQATELNENFPSQQVPAGPSPFASQIPSQTPNGYAAHFNSGNIVSQQNSAAFAPHKQMASHPSSGVPAQISGVNFLSSQGAATSQTVSQTPGGAGVQNSSDILGNVFSQTGASSTIAPQPNRTATNITSVAQPSKDKFETKSTVWNDTLSRGLVNLNISGPKINPLSDIGIDFDALNRKEKRMEKPTTTSVTSTVSMGKAMGSGSGMGCAGAGAIRPTSNHMMNPAMGMGGGPGGMGMAGRPGVGMGMGMGSGPGGVVGMGGGPGVGMGMGMGGGPGVGMGMGVGGGPGVGMGIRGGYGGVGYGGMGQQQMGMGMGTNMGMNTGMGMGMGMGVGQGSQMQHPTGLPPGANVPGGYNSMAGPGGYNQQPYGRGYQ